MICLFSFNNKQNVILIVTFKILILTFRKQSQEFLVL